MSVNPMKWKTRTLVYVVLGFVAFYTFLIYKRKHEVQHEVIIKNSNPTEIWEFVADFSNMKKLNPTIEDFNIIAESGNYDHWKYSVQYTEHLGHLPMVRNTAHGHFAVKPLSHGYSIDSEHRTCFLFGLICLDSASDFRFLPDGKDTLCIESVQYECPTLFSIFCYKEVMYQREEIMKRLKNHFTMTNVRKEELESANNE